MKNFILFLLIVIMFAPIDKLDKLRLPTLVAASTNQFDNEAIEGEFAMSVNNLSTDKQDTKPDAPNVIECKCNGTGKVKSGDGIVDVPCPCGNNCKCGGSAPDTKTICQCGCGKTNCHCSKSDKKRTIEALSPDFPYGESNSLTEPAPPTYYTYFFSARWCGPCTSWKLIEKPKLVKKDKDGKPKWQFGKDKWTYGDNVVEVDVDQRQDLVKLYEIPSYPAFVVVRNGRKLGMKTGYINDVEFGNFHNDTINKDKEVK